MPTLYELLEIKDEKASLDVIKQSYRRLALQNHPDKHPERIEQFKAIKEAYELLSNQNLRDAYDRNLNKLPHDELLTRLRRKRDRDVDDIENVRRQAEADAAAKATDANAAKAQEAKPKERVPPTSSDAPKTEAPKTASQDQAHPSENANKANTQSSGATPQTSSTGPKKEPPTAEAPKKETPSADAKPQTTAQQSTNAEKPSAYTPNWQNASAKERPTYQRQPVNGLRALLIEATLLLMTLQKIQKSINSINQATQKNAMKEQTPTAKQPENKAENKFEKDPRYQNFLNTVNKIMLAEKLMQSRRSMYGAKMQPDLKSTPSSPKPR